MSKQKAFVRYTKNGRIIPGSLIMSYDYPKPGLWAQVLTNICCDQDVPGITSTTPKAWVRYTKQGKLVPGSLVIGDSYPESGIWKEVLIDLCCSEYTYCQGEVQIGEQVWSRCNLNTERYLTGDLIPEVQDPTEWANLTTGAWCYYNNDQETGKIYGKLYNWYAVTDSRGLGTPGYHIPSETEWLTLANYVVYDGGSLKETGTEHWLAPNIGATNSTGFTALGGGYRKFDDGAFLYLKDYGFWWTTTASISLTSRDWALGAGTSDLLYGNSDNRFGFSIRLIKD